MSQTTPDSQSLSHEALQRIETEMRGWSNAIADSGTADDAFRYEMFARRLVAAQHGRPDAVQWAQKWYLDLVQEDLQAVAAQDDANRQRQLDAQAMRAEIEAGRSANPLFQAFLDTLEDPAGELYSEDRGFQGWKYLVWIGSHIGQFERRKDLPDEASQRQEMFFEAVRQASQAALAPRLRDQASDASDASAAHRQRSRCVG